MLLKRSIVLAAGVLLFIVAFIIYFDVSHAQMETRFRAEREKFNVEGATLTASGPANSTQASSSATAPAPVADTNTLLAPVLPPSSSATDSTTTPAAPDTNSAPAPSAAPDTNAAPAPAPSSTMNYPRTTHSPFFQLASYRPSDGMEIQMATVVTGQATTPSTPLVATPATNATPAETNVASAPAPVPVPTAVIASPATHAVPSTALKTNSTASSTVPKATPAASSAVESNVARAAANEGKVIVLLFHQFKPAGVKIPAMYQWTMNQDVFASEMKYIHDNGYHVIPMSDLLKFLRHEISVPPNSVCITIDDGYKSAIVYAAPILKQYGYPWTFFIYPEFITVGEGPGAASWNDLLELQKEGIDIESHSMTHPNLKLHKQKVKGVWHSFTPEEYATWLTNETAGAKALLEQKMGKSIICFAYPYGEYNKQVEDAAIAAGYEAIFTVADNPVHASTNLHSIGRYTITQGVEKNFAAYLRQGALGLEAADPAPGATIANPRPVISATLGYAGPLDPKSIETSVRDFGDVRHDFDPQTNTVRLYLPRDLIAPVVLVNIRVKDASTGQFMVANWHFNYEPEGTAAAIHQPIAPATNAPAASSSSSKTTTSAATNAPEATPPEPMEKSAAGTPLDAHPAPSTPPAPSAPPVSPASTRD
jgi:peptidoglycan/xylan/chitin deacetylase (PgdA/CDA1 family)